MIDTGITNNNRTINGSSAASATYDAFFDKLSTQYKRQFPAMSSVELFWEFTCGGGGVTCNGAFTPYQWCANGTVSGCGEELGGQNGTMVTEACGPVFVDDNNSTAAQSDSLASSLGGNAMIQGSLSVVVSEPSAHHDGTWLTSSQVSS